MVELVIANLPLSRIINLCECTKAWKSFNFREACSEKHPKLFGLMGWDGETDSIETKVYDIKAKEWLVVELVTLPETLPDHDWDPESDESHDYRSEAYHDSMCACDGGLVCIVPHKNLKSCPILVCNPLTSIWKTLPLLGNLGHTKITMVQLVVEEDRKYYRVILVTREMIREALAAYSYNSKTGIWSIMDSGLVYGTNNTLYASHGVPFVFDCTTKTLFNLRDCTSLDNRLILTYSMAKDHLFVLYQSYRPNLPEDGGKDIYVVSEYIGESSVFKLKNLNFSESNVKFFQSPYKEMIFASRDFVLLFADNCEEGEENHHQLIGLYDVSADEWDIPPRLECVYLGELKSLFMCELRWDITP